MDKLIKILNETGFDYEIIKHDKKIFSAKDGAEYFGIEIAQTAPTLILSTDKGYIALIISGAKGKIDFDELEDKLGFIINGMAKKTDIEEKLGFKPGAIPMAGHNLPTVIDKELYKYDYIYGGTGNEDFTLKINAEALVQLNDIIAEI